MPSSFSRSLDLHTPKITYYTTTAAAQRPAMIDAELILATLILRKLRNMRMRRNPRKLICTRASEFVGWCSGGAVPLAPARYPDRKLAHPTTECSSKVISACISVSVVSCHILFPKWPRVSGEEGRQVVCLRGSTIDPGWTNRREHRLSTYFFLLLLLSSALQQDKVVRNPPIDN